MKNHKIINYTYIFLIVLLFNINYISAEGSENNIINSKWGTAQIEFYKVSGELYIDNGELYANPKNSPYIDENSLIKKHDIKKIIIKGKVYAPEDSSFLFGGESKNENSKFINLKGIYGIIDTSRVENMMCMFCNAEQLIIIENLSTFDTTNVVDMSGVFANDKSLSSLSISSWKTENVENMQSMFSGTESLKELYLNNWNTKRVENMREIFAYCRKLGVLDISNWDTSNVMDMSFMFAFDNNISYLPISKWNTAKVKRMHAMFFETFNLYTLDIDDWDVNNVTDMSLMFGESSIEELDLNKWKTKSLSNITSMFCKAINLKKLNISNWDTDNLVTIGRIVSGTSECGVFEGTKSLVNLDLSNWNIAKVTMIPRVFNDSGIKVLDVSSWDTSNILNNKNGYDNMMLVFAQTKNLQYIKLGKDSLFRGGVQLPLIDKEEYTGRWIKVNNNYEYDPVIPKLKYDDSFEFIDKYNGLENETGWYTWERDENIPLKSVVVPKEPTLDKNVDCGNNYNVIINETKGIHYLSDVNKKTVTVIANAEDGYKIKEGVKTKWELDVTNNEKCDLNTTLKPPIFCNPHKSDYCDNSIIQSEKKSKNEKLSSLPSTGTNLINCSLILLIISFSALLIGNSIKKNYTI